MGKLVAVVTLLLSACANSKTMNHAKADGVQIVAQIPCVLSFAPSQRAHYLEDRKKGAAEAEREHSDWISQEGYA